MKQPQSNASTAKERALLRCIKITADADAKAAKELSEIRQLDIVTKAMRRVNAILDEILEGGAK